MSWTGELGVQGAGKTIGLERGRRWRLLEGAASESGGSWAGGTAKRRVVTWCRLWPGSENGYIPPCPSLVHTAFQLTI